MKYLGSCLIAAAGTLLAGCRPDSVAVVHLESTFSLSPEQQAKCPTLDQNVSMISAELKVQDLEATPCPLTVSASNGVLSVGGDCPNIPIGKTRTLTLTWYATSNKGNKVTLAQALGRANLEAPGRDVVDIPFDDLTVPALRPKTKASATEPAQSKDQFNCDRSGTNVCETGAAAPVGGTGDADTCSNLEELCQGTLFSADGSAVVSVDQCPP